MEEAHRVERVVLYVLALDAVNFCFWPVAEDDIADAAEAGGSSGSNKRREKGKNLLEYEHLAIALRRMAERDDGEVGSDGGDDCDGTCRADATYAFSPTNLASLTVESFLSDVRQYLPDDPKEGTEGGQACRDCYCTPNAAERVRLLNELGHGLLAHHVGSATALLRKCCSTDNNGNGNNDGRPSAVKLVQLLTSTFPGFRDEAIDFRGRQISFYKRAQIAVGDLWAAFGRGRRPDTVGGRLTDFVDIHELTTFADYRVPQLLRHVGVLRYAEDLAAKVDEMEELAAGCADELFIRAATVVAVDRLVDEVRRILGQGQVKPGKGDQDEVNAVLLDWHLWQIGEKLDREGTLQPHHRVRTIFY